MACKSIVRLGKGLYFPRGNPALNAWDGHKFACEDDFEAGKGCLVYTFGVSNDLSFEEAMAARGMKN